MKNMRKLFLTLILIASTGIFAMGQLSLINVGTSANSGTGDPLRTMAIKTNAAITQVNTNTAKILLKANIANPTFTTRITTPAITLGGVAITSSAAELNILDGTLVTYTELNRLVGITSPVQTQINEKETRIDSLVAASVRYVTGTPWTSMGYVTGTPWTAMGYLTSQTSHTDVVVDGDFSSQGIILRGASSGTYSILTNSSTNWNTAYGWGNHASAGYTTTPTVSAIVHDSLDAAFSGAELAIAAADSGVYDLGYMTPRGVDIKIAAIAGTSYDSTYIHYRVDSLLAVVVDLKDQVNTILNALSYLDLTPPLFISAELGSFADDTLVILMDTTDIHQDSIPNMGAFYLTEDGLEFGLDTLIIGHDSLFILLDSVGVTGSTYLLDYTASSATVGEGNKLQDSTGNKVVNWINKAVTNNIPAESTLNDGLIAYYKMDETTGTNLNDEIGTNDGTCNSDADVNATGKFGKAVDFTPDGGAITVPDDIFSGITTPTISVSLWIKFDVLNIDERRIFSFLNGSAGPIFEAQIANTGVITFYVVNNSPTQFYQNTAAETNTTDFIHYVFTSAVGTDAIHIYRNGTEIDGRTDDPTGTLAAFHATLQTIGNYYDGGSNSVNGQFDDFRIWNRALTPAEVTELYNLTP